MNVGSLFSGIGGFDLGLERAGMHTSWFCEQDEFCQRVLAKHWPGVPCYDDVQRIHGWKHPGCPSCVEPVDVLCGGFPCQDLSVAGKGAGLDGARSGLWSEYARLIGELRPRYVIVENVPALLARGFGRVLGDLAALGFDAEWDCIPASAFGAPHRRDRVWIVAYPNGERLEGGELLGERIGVRSRTGNGGGEVANSDCPGRGERWRPESVQAEQPAVERSGKDCPYCAPDERCAICLGLDQGRPLHDAMRGRHGTPEGEVRPRWDGAIGSGWWEVEPNVGRVANGVPARVDRLRSLGNALVPQIAEWIGSRVMEYEYRQNPVRW